MSESSPVGETDGEEELSPAEPRKPFWTAWRTALAFAALVGMLGMFGVSLPHDRRVGETRTSEVEVAVDPAAVDVVDPAAGPVASNNAKSGPVAPGQSKAAAGQTAAAAAAKAATAASCAAGKNGGATDTGVTGAKIRLASTVVLSGIGASFLSDSPKGMQAVVQKVNQSGGICGRTLELTLRDDGWDSNRGLTFLRNFMEDKDGFFAMPVVPSSEGLTAAIEAGDIKKTGIPVVGSDGMLRQQYTDPWVWPVATATESTMRIMARHAYSQGARTFGVVYDQRYRFGKEGAAAFKSYVEGMAGASLKGYVGIEPAQSSYGSEVKQFNDACNPCDMVAMLLEPGTAETWIAGRPNRGKMITGGAQTLFNRRFAQNCRAACQGMFVWTGYTPPIDAFASLPGVAAFVNDVRAVDPGVDVSNAFVQGSYLGMSAFVEALRQVGPNLTRDRLRDVMDHMTFEHDLAGKLTWSPTRRNANVQAQGFSLQYAGDTFSGFRNEQTGRITDTTLEGS